MSYTDRQLALKLAVEAYGEHAPKHAYSIELLADQFLKYLETGNMR